MKVSGGPVQVIEFADAEVKRICVENWGGADGGTAAVSTRVSGKAIAGIAGEMTYRQAADVKVIGGQFAGNAIIETFEELRFFTGLLYLGTSQGGAFYNCTNLRSVILPESLLRLGPSDGYSYSSGVFKNTAIESLSIPDNVSLISDSAFSGCTNLKTVRWGSSLKYPAHSRYWSNTFHGCSKLERIDNWPADVKTIGVSDFYGVKVLDWSFMDFSKINSIEGSAFYGANVKEELVLPLVTSLGSYFVRGSNIRRLFLPSLNSLTRYEFAYSTLQVLDIGGEPSGRIQNSGGRIYNLIIRNSSVPSITFSTVSLINRVFVYAAVYDDFVTTYASLASKTFVIGGQEWIDEFGSSSEWADYPDGCNPLISTVLGGGDKNIIKSWLLRSNERRAA